MYSTVGKEWFTLSTYVAVFLSDSGTRLTSKSISLLVFILNVVFLSVKFFCRSKFPLWKQNCCLNPLLFLELQFCLLTKNPLPQELYQVLQRIFIFLAKSLLAQLWPYCCTCMHKSTFTLIGPHLSWRKSGKTHGLRAIILKWFSP